MIYIRILQEILNIDRKKVMSFPGTFVLYFRVYGKDGYILALHRIPPSSPKQSNQKIILLMHGMYLKKKKNFDVLHLGEIHRIYHRHSKSFDKFPQCKITIYHKIMSICVIDSLIYRFWRRIYLSNYACVCVGLSDSAGAWILQPVPKSTAFLLNDLGFDVWLLNARGNTFSQNHTHMNISDPNYWDFRY